MPTYKSASNPPFVVELHGWTQETGRSNMNGVIDVTPYVSQLVFTKSVNAPWETIQVTLRVPFAQLQRVLPGVALDRSGNPPRSPAPGFWVVVRHPNNALDDAYAGGWPAVAWGRCTTINNVGFEVDQHGRIVSTPIVLVCESWLSTVGNSHLAITAAEVVGFSDAQVYSLQEWARDILGPLLEASFDKPPGVALAELWPALARLWLPNTLLGNGQARIADEVPIIHNRETCAKWAPMRVLQHLRVPGVLGQGLASPIPRTTLLNFLNSVFFLEPHLIEAFPTLEYPSTRPNASRESFVNAEDNEGAPVKLPDEARVLPSDMTGLGRALGSQPGLIYRLRPTLIRPLSEDTVRELLNELLPEGEEGAARVPISQRAAEKTGRPTTYGQEPVRLEPLAGVKWSTFSLSEVQSFSSSYDDGRRVNYVTVEPPYQPGGNLDLAGLIATPYADAIDSSRHGRRPRVIDWPFWPQEPIGGNTQISLRDQVDTTVELAYLASGNDNSTEFAGQGRLTVKYRPWLGAGHWVAAELPPNGPFADTAPGETQEGKPGLAGYAHTVTHTIRIDPRTGKTTARTMIDLERLRAQGVGVARFAFPLRPE